MARGVWRRRCRSVPVSHRSLARLPTRVCRSFEAVVFVNVSQAFFRLGSRPTWCVSRPARFGLFLFCFFVLFGFVFRCLPVTLLFVRRGSAPGKGFGLLVLLGCARRRACTCNLSTLSSSTALLWRSYLGVGFALRCFQRLSCPDAATRRCPWRNNRYTGGPSNTVLSY